MVPELITTSRSQMHEVAVYKPAGLTSETRSIIMLHGNFATRARNDLFAQYFSEKGYLVIAPTFRYHYRGNNVELRLGKTSLEDYVSDAITLIEELRIGELVKDYKPSYGDPGMDPILFGHSMGGLVAQIVATRASVRALVLLNSAPPAGISLHTDPDYSRRVKKLAPLIFGGKPFLPDLESMSLYTYNGMPKSTHEELYSHAVHESGTANREILAGSASGVVRLLARIRSKPVMIKPEDIQRPILIVGCGKDKIIPDQIAYDMFSFYMKDSRRVGLIHFPESAHWLQCEEGWQERARRIHSWIEHFV